MKRLSVLAAGVVLALTAAGCAGSTGSGAGVAARIGDMVIEVDELEDVVDRSLADKAVAAAVGADQLGFQRELLNRLVNERLLDEAADRLDVTVADSAVDTRITELEAQSKAQGTTLEQRAATAKIAPDDIRPAIRSGLLSEAILDKLVEGEKVTPQQAAQLDTFTAAHILVASKALADQLLAQIRGGADFAALARKHTTDESSKADGGRLQETTRGRFVPEFEQAALTAPLNKVVGPIQTQFGFHLIKVLARKLHTPESLTDDQRRQILGESSQQKFIEYMSELADDLGIRVNPRFGRWDEEQVAIVEPKDDLSSPSAEPSAPSSAGPGAEASPPAG